MKKLLLCMAVGLLTGVSGFGAAAFPESACPTGFFAIERLLAGGDLSAGCFDQDKGYTNFSYNGPTGAVVRISKQVNVPGPGQDRHFLTFTPDGAWITPFTLSYAIQVSALEPARIINGAVVSASLAGAANVATTLDPAEIAQPTLNTLVNLGAASAAVQMKSRLVMVTNVVTATATSDVTNITNRFDQFTIPEPATIGVLGMGLLALGILRRNKA